MTESSGVGSVTQRQALFQCLGFNDKNGDGVIEKRSLFGAWRDEGYNEVADIDKDGKITEIEAKLYLFFQVRPEVCANERKNLSFTEEEKNIFLKEFNKRLAAIQSSSFDSRFSKEIQILDIIIDMTRVGLFKEARETTKSIEKLLYRRVEALLNIASEMARAKLDKNIIKEVFGEALVIARTIGDLSDKAESISLIALEMDKAGLERNEVIKTFNEALQVAMTMEDKTLAIYHGYGFGETIPKLDTLQTIVWNMAKARLFKEALEVARIPIFSPWDRSNLLRYKIVPEMEKSGLDKNEIKKILNEAGEEIPQTE